ncbi:MAG: chemotaxis protein CheD [Pseudomonadota bacterium]
MTDHNSGISVLDNYFLKPGYIFVPEIPHIISTVVGSSVAVSLFDRKRRLGGMGLFHFPLIKEKNKATALYGNVATLTLIAMMVGQGSRHRDLEAQIFGGAFSREISETDIGGENIDIARWVLTKKNIAIISEDVGGEKGRKIIFNTSTNEIAVLKVDALRAVDWYPYENNR